MFTHTPSIWAVVGASSLWPFFFLKLTFPKSDTIMEVFIFPLWKRNKSHTSCKKASAFTTFSSDCNNPMGQVHCKDDGIFCHEQHILHNVHQLVCQLTHMGKERNYTTWFLRASPLPISHSASRTWSFLFSLQFSLCFQHFICSKSTIIRANLQSHSGAIFICSGSRGLWFTPYNNGWIQGSICQTILLGGVTNDSTQVEAMCFFPPIFVMLLKWQSCIHKYI